MHQERSERHVRADRASPLDEEHQRGQAPPGPASCIGRAWARRPTGASFPRMAPLSHSPARSTRTGRTASAEMRDCAGRRFVARGYITLKRQLSGAGAVSLRARGGLGLVVKQASMQQASRQCFAVARSPADAASPTPAASSRSPFGITAVAGSPDFEIPSRLARAHVADRLRIRLPAGGSRRIASRPHRPLPALGAPPFVRLLRRTR